MAKKDSASSNKNATKSDNTSKTAATTDDSTTSKDQPQQQQAVAVSSKNMPYPVNSRSRFFFMYPNFSVAPFIQSIVNAIQGTDNKGEKVRSVKIGGQGKAIPRVINIAEIVKRRIIGLHQTTELFTREVQTEASETRPAQEFKIACLAITLSLDELDKNAVGYQAPLPVEKVCAQDDEKMMHEILMSGSHITGTLNGNNNNNNNSNNNNNANGGANSSYQMFSNNMMTMNRGGNGRGGGRGASPNYNSTMRGSGGTLDTSSGGRGGRGGGRGAGGLTLEQQQAYAEAYASQMAYPYPPAGLQWIGQPPPPHIQQQVYLQHQQMMTAGHFGAGGFAPQQQSHHHGHHHHGGFRGGRGGRGRNYNNNNSNNNDNANEKNISSATVLSSKIGDATTAAFVPKTVSTQQAKTEDSKKDKNKK